jgi:hypothetical protein
MTIDLINEEAETLEEYLDSAKKVSDALSINEIPFAEGLQGMLYMLAAVATQSNKGVDEFCSELKNLQKIMRNENGNI